MVAVQYGHIEQYPVGSTFVDRQELYNSGVHPALRGGIAWPGGGLFAKACSIVVRPGEYGDDKDRGDALWYTGAGGRPEKGKLQEDQKWDWHSGNRNLQKSRVERQLVRLIRGAPTNKAARGSLNSFLYPEQGFRYDGLYQVTKIRTKKSIHSNHKICAFKLKRVKDQAPAPYPPPIGLGDDLSDSNNSEGGDDSEFEDEQDEIEEMQDVLVSSPVTSTALHQHLNQMRFRSTSVGGARGSAQAFSSKSLQRRSMEGQPSSSASGSGGPIRTLQKSSPRFSPYESTWHGFDPYKNETSQQKQWRNARNAAEKDKLNGLPRISRKKS
ncbi:hypothetical protein D9758_008783 [Tetrapyrgos nigripes]|uniref:YDG domain-containing protein n=1 Tax=Tetrapyrgos nigripes TaxID=182062 RepID=A0A8H5FY77_9AGAR|nr:hypothetical protein D9758_008783 [Tetrapyrgos nigripes]